MRQVTWQRNPDLLAVINVLAAASFLGFLYCMAALLYKFTTVPTDSLVLYSFWFLISMGSLFLMSHGDEWGAYALSIGTMLIGIYEITHGTATFGGALLAAWVIFLALYYLIDTSSSDDEQTRIHNPS